ncbi:hypothetical protein G9A89_005519 [Geosiphon pyriformis]|nr:hypothetical protein G9A89_005519 [Geosiphon pyriformis]
MDTKKLGKQIHHKLLGYLTNTTARVIAETLYIIDTDIKHYVKKRFPQVNQPEELDSEKNKSGFNSKTGRKQAQSILEKFFGEENNAYLWIVEAKKAITTNN